MNENKSGFATAGLVMGIIGICLSFVPILNNASFFLGALAILFSLVCFSKKASKGKAISALVLGVLSIIITISLQSSWSNAIDDVDNSLKNLDGTNTEEILKNNVKVDIGSFKSTTDEYGFSETKLNVTVQNISNENKSFSIQIEAVGQNGTRIETDTIYADSLGKNQSQKFDIFTYVDSNNLNKLKTAKFKVVEVTMD